MQTQTYFDFKLCFKEVLKETLENYKYVHELIEENYLELPKELENANDLFRFISDEKAVKELLDDFEISEDQQIDFLSDFIDISFYQDTSTHNEGGSHLGGYEYVFTINTDEGTFIGLEVVNHN